MSIPLLIATLSVAGLWLTVQGLRCRRVGDHPFCRRCGFDLTGRPLDSKRCGECGADLTRSPRAIRHGSRERRRGVVAGGAVLLLVSLGLGARSLSPRWAEFNGSPYKPAWWLRLDLDGTPEHRGRALAGLTGRAATGQVTAARLRPSVEWALARQASAAPWEATVGQLIETAHAAGLLDSDQWARYAAGAADLKLIVRPVVLPGDELAMAFSCNSGRVDQARFIVMTDAHDMHVDGGPGPTPPPDWSLGHPFVPAGQHLGGLVVGPTAGHHADDRFASWDARPIANLSVGVHTLTATVRLTVYDPTGDLDHPRADAKFGHPPPSPAVPAGTVEVPVSTTFAVADAARAPPLLVHDETARATVVSGGLVILSYDARRHAIELSGGWRPPPYRLFDRVYLRRVGSTREQFAGYLWVDAPDQYGSLSGHAAASAFSPTDRFDVVFRPAPHVLARKSLDLTPIWDGECVIHDVPVIDDGWAPPPTR